MISQQPDGAVQDRFDLGNGCSLILVTLLFGLNFILCLVTEKAVEKRRELRVLILILILISEK